MARQRAAVRALAEQRSQPLMRLPERITIDDVQHGRYQVR